MELAKIYEAYNSFNKEYIEFIDILMESNLDEKNEKDAVIKLLFAQNRFEELKIESDNISVDEKNMDNIKDLRYLIVDSLFLSSDLLHFYKLKEVERFKMRAVNYINKRRRAEMFS